MKKFRLSFAQKQAILILKKCIHLEMDTINPGKLFYLFFFIDTIAIKAFLNGFLDKLMSI